MDLTQKDLEEFDSSVRLITSQIKKQVGLKDDPLVEEAIRLAFLSGITLGMDALTTKLLEDTDELRKNGSQTQGVSPEEGE